MFPNTSKRTHLAAFLAVSLPLAMTVAVASPLPRLVVPILSEAGTDLSLTQSYCDARASVGAMLQRDFAEEPRLAALTADGLVMEIWTSNTLGTWTLLHHGADGITCVVTTGRDWTAGSSAALLLEEALAGTVHQS